VSSTKCLHFLGNPVFKSEPQYDSITKKIIELGNKRSIDVTQDESEWLQKNRYHDNQAKPRKIFQYGADGKVLRQYALNADGSLRSHVQEAKTGGESYTFRSPKYLCHIPADVADKLAADSFGTGFSMFEIVEDEAEVPKAPGADKELQRQVEDLREELAQMRAEHKELKKTRPRKQHRSRRPNTPVETPELMEAE
jgi:hypothetical protein